MLLRLFVGVCREYLAYMGKGMDKLPAALLGFLQTRPMDMLLGTSRWMSISDHWAYRDKVPPVR